MPLLSYWCLYRVGLEIAYIDCYNYSISYLHALILPSCINYYLYWLLFYCFYYSYSPSNTLLLFLCQVPEHVQDDEFQMIVQLMVLSNSSMTLPCSSINSSCSSICFLNSEILLYLDSFSLCRFTDYSLYSISSLYNLHILSSSLTILFYNLTIKVCFVFSQLIQQLLLDEEVVVSVVLVVDDFLVKSNVLVVIGLLMLLLLMLLALVDSFYLLFAATEHLLNSLFSSFKLFIPSTISSNSLPYTLNQPSPRFYLNSLYLYLITTRSYCAYPHRLTYITRNIYSISFIYAYSSCNYCFFLVYIYTNMLLDIIITVLWRLYLHLCAQQKYTMLITAITQNLQSIYQSHNQSYFLKNHLFRLPIFYIYFII